MSCLQSNLIFDNDHNDDDNDDDVDDDNVQDDDCGDGSDEANCQPAPPGSACRYYEWQCASGYHHFLMMM